MAFFYLKPPMSKLEQLMSKKVEGAAHLPYFRYIKINHY